MSNNEVFVTGQRLQKVLAAAGVASRRLCEQYISQGRVEVNGQIVTELGSRVFPETDQVRVDGKEIQLDVSKRYIVLNKPFGVVSSMKDEQNRPDLRNFTDQFPERLYNVGRLDAETTGALLLTNDGQLAHVLAHPSFGVTKTYLAKLRGNISNSSIRMLLAGFELEDGFIKADAARILPERQNGNSLVEISLHSGKNRIVRRMFSYLQHPVLELARLSFGPIKLGALQLGKTREVTAQELSELLALVRGSSAQKEQNRG